jgi:hypothetical protein
MQYSRSAGEEVPALYPAQPLYDNLSEGQPSRTLAKAQ